MVGLGDAVGVGVGVPQLQRVALSASSRITRAVAEVLVKGGVVLLHSRCGRGVGISHCAVDHIEAALPLIQPQFEVGSAVPGKYCARHSMLKMRLGAYH